MSGGVKRRSSFIENFRLDLEGGRPSSSTTGIDFGMQAISGSVPNTPGFELSHNPLDDLVIEGTDNQKTKTLGNQEERCNVEEHELIFSLDDTDGRNTLVNVKARQVDNNVGSFDNEEYLKLYEASRLNWKDPPMNRFRILACCLWTFTSGMSDAAPGALLPHMETYYDISYSIVSMIWMSCAVGYIVIACTTHLILKKFPKHLLATIGVAFQIIAYALITSGTVFPVICVAFYFNGMGLALGLTQYNVFLSNFTNASTCLAFMHGSYGIGALIAPLIAQSMLNHNLQWYKYFFILLGASVFNLVNIYWSFRNTSKDLADFEKADAHRMEMEQLQIFHEKGGNYKDTSEFYDSIRDYRTWLLCAFVFFYQGGEVSLGGWMVTFLLAERNGDPEKTGYVASGYWGGLTLGRFLLTTLLYKKLGGRRSIAMLTEAIAILLLISWLVPNLYVSATCTTVSGLFIGPIYPLMIALVSHPKILPRKILTQSLLIMTSMGSSGGAVIPLLVGIISDATATWVLFPIVIGLFQLMIISWLLLPNVENTTNSTSFWKKYIW